jgi:DNA-binding protein HU-beta
VNKTDLINKLAERLGGDKKVASEAVEGFIDLVEREVQRGGSVSLSGFGVFEKRARAARTARNPRTGEAVRVKKTTVPAFRPGKYFKDVLSGAEKLPKAPAASARTAAAKPAATRTTRTAAAKPAATRTTRTAAAKPAATRTTRTAAAKPAATRTAAAKATPVAAPKKAAPKAAVKAAPKAAVKAAPKAAAKKAPAKKAAAKKK